MASRKKTTIERMDTALQKILDEYEDSIETNLTIITKLMGQKGATALRAASRETFTQHTGKYAKGWTYTDTSDRFQKAATIHNTQYSMPHLLENDHVVRNGTKRVVSTYRGREHIAPIAQDLADTYFREVESKL